MIHGTSKQITEAKETGNIYYESAYPVVKPEYASAEHELLEHETHKILHSMGALSGMKWAWGMSFWMTRVAPPAAVAATATILYFTAI